MAQLKNQEILAEENQLSDLLKFQNYTVSRNYRNSFPLIVSCPHSVLTNW